MMFAALFSFDLFTTLLNSSVVNWSHDTNEYFPMEVSSPNMSTLLWDTGVETGDYFRYMDHKKTASISTLITGKVPTFPFFQIENFVDFWFYKNGIGEGVRMKPNCTDCLTDFDKSAPLVILCHGWSSSPRLGFGQTFQSAFADGMHHLNVIYIHWEKLAAGPYFLVAVPNVNPVGKFTAELINFLVENNYTTMNKVHFVGHSLGSHVGNYIAANLKHGKMARITALDPANPVFRSRAKSQRLDPSDAEFVEVIHTSSYNYLPKSSLGLLEPCGHADFYPNFGSKQPDCSVFNDDLLFGYCSHAMAYEYFARTINDPYMYPACQCVNWEELIQHNCSCLDAQHMGWATNTSTRGIFVVQVNLKQKSSKQASQKSLEESDAVVLKTSNTLNVLLVGLLYFYL